MDVKSNWKLGSSWTVSFPDGRVADTGEIAEFNPPQRMAITWRNEWNPDMKAEGFSRCTFDLQQMGSAVKLTVTHTMEIANSKFIEAVPGGRPFILSNLKSLLETECIVLKYL